MKHDQIDIHISRISGYTLPEEVKKMISADGISRKGFDACHQMLRQETGIWVPELDQVFKDLDNLLGLPAYKA